MVLGDRDRIEITRCDDIDLPGVNIDSKFNFDKYVTNLCSRVNMQLKVVGGGQGDDNLPLPVPRSPASRTFLFLCLPTPALYCIFPVIM